MPSSVFQPRSTLRLTVSALALSLGLAFAHPVFSQTTPASQARGQVAGSEMSGYGRFVFTLDRPVKAQVRASSGVVVLSFDDPVEMDVSRLAQQVPAYVSVIRRDPDGRSLRFATTRPFKVNLMEAGEKLFLDFLPDSWSGLPPSLPPDVIESLARRAREAEEEVRKVQRDREKREPRDITARVGNGPTFTRLILDIGQNVPVDIKRDGEALSLTVDAALRFNPALVKPQLPESVQDITAEIVGGVLKVGITVAKGAEMRPFREDDTIIIDFPRPRNQQPETAVVIPVPAPETAQARGAEPSRTAPSAATRTEAPAPPPIRAVTDAVQRMRPVLERSETGLKVTVGLSQMTPAAAFVRDSVLWMVFDTKDMIEAVPVPAELRDLVSRLDVDRAAGAAILRLTLTESQPVSIAPATGGNGWTATIGGVGTAPTEPVLFRRGVGSNGRTILSVRMPKLGQIVWLDDPETGERIGVVTAQAPAHGLSKAQSFVDLTAHPTVHGLLIAPRADDVVVDVGLDEVIVSRESGLTVSLGVRDTAGAVLDGSEQRELLLDAKGWDNARRGNIRERTGALFRAAADAPRNERTDARHKLAFFRLANGDVTDSLAILKVIEQDDPTAAATKPFLMLRAIAAVMANDGREAMRLLTETPIAVEPEALLWRAVLDSRNRRWSQGLIGFRQVGEVLDRYPEDIQIMARLLSVQAGIEGKDHSFALQQLDLVQRLMPVGSDPSRLNLLKGRIALLQGRNADAVSAFDAAALSADRGVEAEARLDRVLLKVREKTIKPDDAIAELETIAVIWRRGETEVRAQAALGELYAERGLWRQAFTAARRATEIMPEHELSRQLHDAMAERFEALFLDGKADELPKVEAVGLFYDFRSLMPISRRGDEIVRRLADRLAELDLLDQASELLQHQVDNRLGGVTRSRVAMRLAVLHLMNRKPAEAVRTLQSTRNNDLPEDMRRGRLLLEARGLSELSRTDLALEVLAAQRGPDVDRLRADVLWRGKRWKDAGEAYERVLGDTWRGQEELSDQNRADAMRAGVAYVLADDRIALDRLRQKFLPKMADSVDARPFALVTGESRQRAQEFRDIARQVVANDTLSDFLNIYRQRYPEAAGAPRNPKAAEEALKEMGARGQQSQTPAVPPRQAPG